MRHAIKDLVWGIERALYAATVWLLQPLNWLLSVVLANRVRPGSVLHVSVMVHVPAYMVRILRDHGVDAQYLAVGRSPWWHEADFNFRPTRWPLLSVVKEMWWVWSVVSRYEIVHSHFMMSVSRAGWEWPLLARMGRKLVVHYRGCEIRDRERNMAMHPRLNICQECDYRPYVCKTPFNVARRPLAARYGNAFLVTTPDMKDFSPAAQHIPFFITSPEAEVAQPKPKAAFKIVHATNHPGIEGSRQIRQAIEALVAKGHAINYVELNGVTHARVLAELADADLTIGKMKMGYYANLQIESMAAGVPAVTCVRPEFITDDLRASGFIFASLDDLERVLEHYLTHPAELQAKRALARESIFRLHDNGAIAAAYQTLYAGLRASSSHV
jgi:hypothetical protein